MKKSLMNLLFGLFVMVAVSYPSAIAQLPTEPTLDQVRAEKFIVQTLNGKKIELNKLLGEGKPVVLDIWATWCGPCRQEIPHLIELAAQHKNDGLIIIGLTVEDSQIHRERVKSFVKEFGMNYMVGFASEQLYKSFNGGTSAMRIPQTFIFGEDGKLVKRLIGYNNQLGRQMLTAAVAEAISGNKATRADQGN